MKQEKKLFKTVVAQEKLLKEERLRNFQLNRVVQQLPSCAVQAAAVEQCWCDSLNTVAWKQPLDYWRLL